jgi:hypothetical protein
LDDSFIINYKDIEKKDRGIINVLSRHFPEGAEGNYENAEPEQRVSWSRFEPRKSRITYNNWMTHKYKFPALIDM